MTADPGSGTPMSERMQALLSRAVEDQISEQRQVAGAMNEVRSHLAHLSAELQQLRDTAGGAADEEIQRQVAGVAADVREAIRVLGDRIDGVSALVQQRGNDLAEIRNVIDNVLRPRVDGVDSAMRDLRGAFSGIGSRVADLPGRQDIEAMISRAGTDTSGLDERLESLQGWIEEVHAGLFGEDGVHPRVEALVEHAAQGVPVDEIAARIDASVRTAVMASEKRITAHVDEAVLALAEALLRKRSRTGGLGQSAFDTGPIPVVPPAPPPAPPQESAPQETQQAQAQETQQPQEPDDHGAPESFGAAPEPAIQPAEPAEPAEALPPPPPATTALPAHIDLGDSSSESAYQPATGPSGDGHDGLDDDDDARRRRPWWRPGD